MKPSVSGKDKDQDARRGYLFCYKCGHLWYPQMDTAPKRCSRCHSSRWDVPERRERVCKFCDRTWTISDVDEPCPSCGKRQSEGSSDRSSHCNQCDYDWIRKKDTEPKKCPLCLSAKWKEPKAEQLMCQRCRHVWHSQTEAPKRCPSCQSSKWNVPVRSVECQRCGHGWILRSDSDSKICPSCRSPRWRESPRTYTCPKCERTVILRSDSRIGRCPYCDKPGRKTFKCSICGNVWTGGISTDRCERCYAMIPADDGTTSMVLWTDGRYTLRYVSRNNFGFAYLWDRDVPVSTVYFHTICQRYEMTVEQLVHAARNGTMDEEWELLSKEMLAAENGYVLYIDYFMRRLSLSYSDARILAIHFTGMGPEAIAVKFGMSIEVVRDAFDRIMGAYGDSGIVVDDTIFTENPFEYYGNKSEEGIR